jgi:hypothetical protein
MTFAERSLIKNQIQDARMSANRMRGEHEDRLNIMVALEQSERVLRTVPETQPEPVVVTEDDGEV